VSRKDWGFIWNGDLSAMVRFIDQGPALGLPTISTRFYGFGLGRYGIGVIRQTKEAPND